METNMIVRLTINIDIDLDIDNQQLTTSDITEIQDSAYMGLSHMLVELDDLADTISDSTGWLVKGIEIGVQ
jgi:hypothetical protein